MSSAPSNMTVAAIIVAAGLGSRSRLDTPKQFSLITGKPMLRHSAETLAAHSGVDDLWIVIGAGQEELAHQALVGIDYAGLVIGGDTRQQSVWNGLQAIHAHAGTAPQKILIHDAARPFLPVSVVDRLLSALNSQVAAIPVLPVVDTMLLSVDDQAGDIVDRDPLRRVQTPQAFDFKTILRCHQHALQQENNSKTASDDAQLVRHAGHRVALVDGDERLKKYTLPQDFKRDQEPRMTQTRTGMGFDVHQLAAGEELWLGGVKIEHERGLSGHSDADVLLHALTDALLGAVGAGDIGDHFPPTDPKWRGVRSEKFVEHAVSVIKQQGGCINNVDMTIICEAPKIKPHREQMRQSIATMLAVAIDQVSVKATTTERLGFAGRGEGIAAQAIATISMEE